MNDIYVERLELPVLWAGGKHGNLSSLHPCTSAVHIILYFGDNLSNSINRFCTPSSIRYFDMKHVA